MMVLKENEICPYGNTCIYNTGKNGPCWGAKGNRNNTFYCEYFVNGRIMEGGIRLPSDKTGRMQIIME